MNTLIFDAYDAFRDLIIAALPNVQVYDGPVAAGVDDDLYVIVGTDNPRADAPVTSIGTPGQDWVGLGGYDREETFAILACVVATTGEEDFATARDAAKAAVDAIFSALRPPPHGTGDGMLNATLNQGGNGTGWCGGTVLGLEQGPVGNGIAVYVPFSVACTARV